MKKKLIAIAFAAFILIGIGNIVHATSENESWSFNEMLPFMQDLHPNIDQQELEQMYKDCHG